MPSDRANLYMIRQGGADDGDGWVTPEPAAAVIGDAVAEATDLDADAFDDVESYVDRDALAAVLAGDDEEVRFEVEGHEVVVTAAGEVTVGDA